MWLTRDKCLIFDKISGSHETSPSHVRDLSGSHKGRHQKKNCRFGENVTIGREGVRKIIEFSSFTNDEKHGRGGVSE